MSLAIQRRTKQPQQLTFAPSARRAFPHSAACLLCVTLISFTQSAHADFETSIDYTMYRLATEYNDPSAQYLVGRNYLTGKTVEKDVATAVKWFEMAAKQDHHRAQFQLGKMYLHGEEVKTNLNYAYYYLNKAAQSNYLDAQYEIGNYFLTIKPKQTETALTWFKKAAQRDHVRAMLATGKLLYNGSVNIKPNQEEGRQWIERAAEAGLLEATHFLAKLDGHPQDSPNTGNLPNFSEDADESQTTIIVGGDSDSIATTAVDDYSDKLTADELYTLALSYLNGEGRTQDSQLAVKYFQLAADQEHGKAQYELALMYRDGIGTEKNEDLAVKWFDRASQSGVQRAKSDMEALNIKRKLDEEVNVAGGANQFHMGLKYLNGDGVEQNPETAAQWFLRAAEKDHPEAQYELGIMFRDGYGVRQDLGQAKLWMQKSSNLGNRHAAKSLKEINNIIGNGGNTGENTIVQNHSPASGLSENKFKVVEVKQPIRQAKLNTAAQPEASATENNSENNTENNTENTNDPLDKQLIALKSSPIFPFIKSATNGNTEAQYTLGIKFLKGEDVEKDVPKAVKWLRIAANNNYPIAQGKLGELYLNGIGVSQNYSVALDWLEKAAENEDAHAQYLLGDLYKKGLGVEKSNTTAIMWYRKAANNGHKEARKRLGGCRVC